MVDIKSFLQERLIKRGELTKEMQSLNKKVLEEKTKYKEVILYSIPLTETLVSFRKEQLDNLFSSLSQPSTGLFLREIYFYYKEDLYNTGDDGPQYLFDVCIKFKFNNKDFDGDISMTDLTFDDEGKRISEQVMGVGYDPCFKSVEKYIEVRDTLKIIVEELKNI